MERNFKDYFYYDESSPTKLRWKIKKGRREANSVAGSFASGPTGEKRTVNVRLNQKNYVAHRIIWILLHGEIPSGMVIDHINGNPWDNHISNLACKSLLHNSQNIKKYVNNTTGFTGVVYVKYGEVVYGITASICNQGNRSVKYFPIKGIGIEGAINNARKWRDDKMSEFNENGANFTDRHKENDPEYVNNSVGK